MQNKLTDLFSILFILSLGASAAFQSAASVAALAITALMLGFHLFIERRKVERLDLLTVELANLKQLYGELKAVVEFKGMI